MSDPSPLRSAVVGRRVVAVFAVLVALGATACAKADQDTSPRSREPTVTFVTAKLVPTGKTVRAAVADGSITQTTVPGDVVADEALEDPGAIDCLVAGRSIPEGTLLRKSMFVTAASVGLERGYTNGTTLDMAC